MKALSGQLPHIPKTGGPFLPLAFRFAASFCLLILHFALDLDLPENSLGEWAYVFFLNALFVESVIEAGRSTLNSGTLFAVPGRFWIFLNLFLLCFLVTILVSFHGADRTGLAALYVFPVLASAFYVGITTTVGVGVISILMYAICLGLSSSEVAPSPGDPGIIGEIQYFEQFWLIAFTTLQIMVATLVVAAIRKRLETLRSNLNKSVAVADELSALYRNVVESMSSGLITTDLNGTLTSINPSAERILQSHLLLGQPLEMLDIVELARDETIPGAIASFANPGSGCSTFSKLNRSNPFERTLTTYDGAEKIVGGTISPLMNSENQQTGFLLLFQDLTGLKAMEARMLLSERLAAVGELSSELAHEVRTPLASIQGCIQILRRPNPDGTVVDKVMRILLRESERVGAVVSDFLELAKPRDLKLELLRLPDLLEEVRAAWDTDPRFANSALDIETPPDVWIRSDALAFHQILTNLLSNSQKAVRGMSQPIIKITQKIHSRNLELAVADNGIGMDKSQVSSIFAPFRSGFSEGTGIGMSVVFQFTQRMNWEIRVDSEIGAGTTIKLIIPLEERP